MNHEVQVTVKVWAIIVFVLCIVGAVAAGVTWSDHLQRIYVAQLHQETLDRQAQSNYATCVTLNNANTALAAVVNSAYSGTVALTPKQVTMLPARTQQLLADLEPLLTLSAANTAGSKAAVLASIPAQEKCIKPPGVLEPPASIRVTPTT